MEQNVKQNTKQKKTGKIILGIAILAVVAAGLLLVYLKFRPTANADAKTVTIEVIDDKQEQTNYTVEGNAEYLKDVMDQAEGLTYEGTTSNGSMMVITVNGVRADYNEDKAYWAFYVNGEYCNYGIEEQPVNDQDTFKIEYTPAQ